MSADAERPYRGTAVAAPEQDAEPSEQQAVLARILAQQAAVAQIGQRALVEQQLDALLDEAVELVARILQTELASIARVLPDGNLLVVAGRGWGAGVVGQLVLGGQTSSQSGYTLQTGGPLVVDDLTQETRFTVVGALRERGATAGISARIGDRDQPFGVLSAFTAERGGFSPDDANFLQAVANVLAAAVGRARIETELRRSRDQLAAIVRSVNDGIVVRAPDWRLLYVNEPAARMNGYPSPEAMLGAPRGEEETRFTLYEPSGEPMRSEDLPSRVALRTGERTPEKLMRAVWHDHGEERWQYFQATPIRGEDGRVEQVVVVIRDVTAQRREQTSRQFLTEALATLSTILEENEAAHRLAELCVPRLADFCAIDLLDADGSIQQLAIAHIDPRRVALAWHLRREHPLKAGDETGPARVIREGRPEFVSAINREGHRAAGAARADVAAMIELGLSSWLRVPLLARGRPIGALTLAKTRERRTLDEHDLELAEELGARAGIALENARLYETAEDRRSQLDAVLTAIADAVLVFDARGRLRLTNRAGEELFAGDPPQTVEHLTRRVRRDEQSGGDGLQRPTDTSAAEHEQSTDQPANAARVRDALADLEGELQIADSERWYDLRPYRSKRTPADRGERHGPFVVVLRDVTEARAAHAARDAFLGILSHELRTPITTIYGGSELLGRALDLQQREDVVRDIRAESERLARLVEDLLVMTRVERGGVEIGDEPVLIQRLIPRVVQSLAARLPSLQIETHVADNLPAVRGDVTYLEQALRNLLTNAVRYGDGIEHGIRLIAEEAHDFVRVRVQDNGPGLSKAEAERVFDLFYRSRAARAVPGGAGIGLFVCRRLVEAMGGRISARSRPEGGAEFDFTLPVLDPDQP